MAWEDRMCKVHWNDESKSKQNLSTLASRDNGIKTDLVVKASDILSNKLLIAKL